MVRTELLSDANFVGVVVAGNCAVQCNLRSGSMPLTTITPSASAAEGARWLRLSRQGTMLRAYAAATFRAWNLIGASGPTPTEMVFAGPFVASGTPGVAAATVFDKAALTTGTPPLQEGPNYLCPYNAPKLALDGSAGAAPLAIAFPRSAAAQIWTIVSNGAGYYSIRPGGSQNSALTVADTSGTLADKQRFYWLHTAESADTGGGDTDSAGATDLAEDDQGDLYVATRMGVQVCDRNGRVEGILTLPAGQVSSLTIGGTAFDTLTIICGGKIYTRALSVHGVPNFADITALPPPSEG